MSSSVLKKCIEVEEKSRLSSAEKQKLARKLKSKNKKKTKIWTLLNEPASVKKDNTSKNIKSLKKTSKATVPISQILEQHKGRSCKNQPKIQRKRKEKSETTVFTDEDFSIFEKEYFVHGRA